MIRSKNPAASNAAQGTAVTMQRCEHALELLHTHRGNASAEVDNPVFAARHAAAFERPATLRH